MADIPSTPTPPAPFGERAVRRGFCSEAQVQDALKAQYTARAVLGKHLFIGELLLLRGAITAGQLATLLRDAGDAPPSEEARDAKGRRFFGEIAVAKGLITPAQLVAALDRQRADDAAHRPHRLVGEILFEEGSLTRAQVEAVAAEMLA